MAIAAATQIIIIPRLLVDIFANFHLLRSLQPGH